MSSELQLNPTLGTSIGKGIYKIRLKIQSNNKGKSSGARVITYVKINDAMILLLSIYDKSEIENISISDFQSIMKKYL